MRAIVPLLGILCACQGTVRLYEGQPQASSEVGTVHIRGDGRLSAPADPGDVAYDAALVAFNGTRTSDPLHKVEVLPGQHEFTIRWQRFVVPSMARWYPRVGAGWESTSKGEHVLTLTVEPGRTYSLEWIPEWRSDRPPGPPMFFDPQ